MLGSVGVLALTVPTFAGAQGALAPQGDPAPLQAQAAGDEGTTPLEGDGSFGPLFKEPESFIDGPQGPGRELDEDNDPATEPNETFIKQSPSECKVLEGENRTLAQKNADPEDDGFINCKVPSASIAVTPFDNKLISFNAVDSTENNEASIVFEYGVKAISDRTRAFTIPVGAPTGTNFKIPNPEDGGANPEPEGNPDEQPVIPGATDENGQNDGGLFCADLNFLPDGRVIAVGGTNYYNDPGAPDNPDTAIREDEIGAIELQGIKNSRIYDPRTNNWTQVDRMNKGRWYPTLVTLGKGELLAASGVTKLIKPQYVFPPVRKDGAKPEESGDNVTATETLPKPNGEWKENGDPDKTGPELDQAERSLPLFARLHLLPNGHVFYNASGQSFNPFGQGARQATWNMTSIYDPEGQDWEDFGIPGTTDTGPEGSDGAPGAPVRDPGFRGSTSSTMLPLKSDEDGNYEKAEFLTAGGLSMRTPAGNPNPSPGSYFTTRQSRLTTVETQDGRERVTTRATGPLKNRSQAPDPTSVAPNSGGDANAAPDAPSGSGRWYGSTQVLPTGQVVKFAGADRDEVAFPGVEQAIKEVEIFEPSADNPDNPEADDRDGAWRSAESSQRPRTYHNTSALLPDGRVLLGGHATISTGYTRNTEIIPGRGPNGHDPTSEIWTPPYPDAEPRLTASAPDCADNGDTITVDTDAAEGEVQNVVMSRNTSQTHVVDADQRNVEVPFTEVGDGKLEVKVPDGNALPPGPNMTFVNRKGADGKTSAAPSIAEQMLIGPKACEFVRGAATSGGGDDDDRGGDSSSAGDSTSGLEVKGLRTSSSNCLPKGLRASSRGIGNLRLGMDRVRATTSAGLPANIARRAFRYCVLGGGRTYVSFSGRGRAQMIVSVQAQRGPKGLTRGNSTAQVRRAYKKARTLGRNHRNLVARLPGGGAIAFGVERGRVRYVAIVDKRLAGDLNLLRYYLRGVRLQ